MKFGLKQNVIDKIGSVFEQYGSVKEVLGSRAMGNYRNGSDIDLPYMIDLPQFEYIDNTDETNHINRRGKTFYERSRVTR